MLKSKRCILGRKFIFKFRVCISCVECSALLPLGWTTDRTGVSHVLLFRRLCKPKYAIGTKSSFGKCIFCAKILQLILFLLLLSGDEATVLAYFANRAFHFATTFVQQSLAFPFGRVGFTGALLERFAPVEKQQLISIV